MKGISEGAEASFVPERPNRSPRTNQGRFGKSEPTFATRRGSSDAANGRGFNQPYKPGANADDYTHGYLDVIDLQKALAENRSSK
jgi:hypothetical protein